MAEGNHVVLKRGAILVKELGNFSLGLSHATRLKYGTGLARCRSRNVATWI